MNQCSKSEGLALLEARLRQDLSRLSLPAAAWVPPQSREDQPLLDVAIIGGGQAGLAVAASLQHLGMRAVVFDRSPAGFEGPWATTARMETLRSPKELVGPALGIASLTFRAWYEASFGDDAWAQLDKIPRLDWMRYLRWYRQVLDLDVRNLHEVTAVQPRADGVVALDLRTPDGPQRLLARRVVLATGHDGLGGPKLPAFASGLPQGRWCHSSDPMDFARLKGLRVGVIGAGASAMDSAATALEAGAASVDLIIRRHDLPRINKAKGATNPGLAHGHLDLPDAWKWRIRHYIGMAQVPPPRGSTLRVSRHANAHFHLGCPVLAVQAEGEAVNVVTPKGVFALDFLVFSTGFTIDWLARPEFASFAGQVRAWGDRFAPAAQERDADLAGFPDLGRAFELQERTPGAVPGLDRIHCFCYPASLTHGAISGDIPGVSVAARRLAEGMASLFYQEDIEAQFAAIVAYEEPEIMGDEWTPAPARPAMPPAPAGSATLSLPPNDRKTRQP